MGRLLRKWFGYSAGYEDCRKRCIEILDEIMSNEMMTPLPKHVYGREAGMLFRVAIGVDRKPMPRIITH